MVRTGNLLKPAKAAEQDDIAHKVGMAALKFADLQNQRTTNYVFDPERFTAFEGKTGPYLLYATVRIKSRLKNMPPIFYVIMSFVSLRAFRVFTQSAQFS